MFVRSSVLISSIISVLLVPSLSGAITIDRAEMRPGNELRVEGDNAVAGASISVDGTVRGSADNKGRFRIEFSLCDIAR